MSLLKKADVPADLQKIDKPVSKEFDAVMYVYRDMYNNQITSIPWRDFQKRYQQFAQKYNKLFTDIRKNKPQVTLADMFDWLEENKGVENYSVDYSTYNEPEHSFRDVEQLVVQINRSADASRIIAEDPVLAKYVDFVSRSSEMSGHPAGMETVGWLRLDFVNEDWLLVDEVQSDLVNSVTQAKAIVEHENFDDFVANIENEKVKQLVLENIDAPTFEMRRQHFIRQGYTFEKLDEIKNKLVELFQDWAEYGIASLIEIARKQGIKNVAIHTAETISQRDASVDAEKIKMFYDNLAKSFGFKKQQLDIGELKGNFWVRTASSRNDSFLVRQRIAAGVKKIDPRPLVEQEKLYKLVRTDPRQESIYGPEHAEELKEFHSRPKPKAPKPEPKVVTLPEGQEFLFDAFATPKAMKSSLFQDFGMKEAGLYSVEDLDDYDSPMVYEMMGLHDRIHLNPVRGVVPDYGSEYQAQQIWQFTFNAVKGQLLPAVQQGMFKCSPAGKQKVKALVDEATTALAESASGARMRQYGEAGKKVEFAFGKLHSAIEVIRMETRKKRKGKPMPVGIPKSLGDYT